MNYNIKIVFNYESKLITILGKSNEKMKDIYIKDFLTKQEEIYPKRKFFLVTMVNGEMIQMKQKI